jgi:hypothetical protein
MIKISGTTGIDMGGNPVSNATDVETNRGNLTEVFDFTSFSKPNEYKNKVIFTKTDPAGFSIPAGVIVKVNNNVIKLENIINLSLNTNLDIGAKVPGTDYYVYISEDGSAFISANKNITTSRLIGGFHYGLTGETEIRPSPSLKTESDMIMNRGIKGYSFWDLAWLPSNGIPEGKVLVNNMFWRDIYPADSDYAIRGYSSCFAIGGGIAKLAGGAATNGRLFPKIPISYGGNGTINYGSLTWYESSEIAGSVGGRLPNYAEFANSSYGVVEQKSLGELGYATGTGNIQHYPELESKWGVEMATGVQYYWGSQIMNGYGTTDFAHRLNLTEGRGSLYSTSNSPIGIRLGGYELGTSTADVAGSRYLNLSDYVWRTDWYYGFCVLCDHMNLAV